MAGFSLTETTTLPAGAGGTGTETAGVKIPGLTPAAAAFSASLARLAAFWLTSSTRAVAMSSL